MVFLLCACMCVCYCWIMLKCALMWPAKSFLEAWFFKDFLYLFYVKRTVVSANIRHLMYVLWAAHLSLLITEGAEQPDCRSCPPQAPKWVMWVPPSHVQSSLRLVAHAAPAHGRQPGCTCVHVLTRWGKPLNKLPANFLQGKHGRRLPARSDPLAGREGETKCGTKNEQMKELACNSDPYGLFLSSRNKKCNSCDEYSPTVVFLCSNNNFNWTLLHVESLCFLGHKSNMWSRDLKNGLLKDSNASISPRTRLINLLCKMITFYREESLLDIH